jgi:selenocysteine lyase/cysteine desulfurase
VREWTELVHRAGARAIVDGVSFCPHGLPDIESLGADIYLFSLYKVYGPHLGVMYVRRDFADELPHQGHFFNIARAEQRFTAAGADHAQVAAVNGVMDYLEAVAGRHGFGDEPTPARARAVRTLFRDHESALLQPLLDFLSKHPGIHMIGKDRAAERAPTVAFTVGNHRSTDLAGRLAEFDLGVGVGHFYAYRLVKALNIDTSDGVLRASFVHYTSAEEISRLISALDATV